MRKFFFSLVFAFAALAMAADKPSSTPTAKPATPTVSAELRAKYWRAQAEAITAQHRAEQALATYKAAIQSLATVCGAQPVDGPDGEPACPAAPDVSRQSSVLSSQPKPALSPSGQQPKVSQSQSR